MAAQAKIDAAVGIVKPKRPRPPKFPMKFEVFLRHAFGGRYYADRLHLYRKFRTESIVTVQIVATKTRAQVLQNVDFG